MATFRPIAAFEGKYKIYETQKKGADGKIVYDYTIIIKPSDIRAAQEIHGHYYKDLLNGQGKNTCMHMAIEKEPKHKTGGEVK